MDASVHERGRRGLRVVLLTSVLAACGGGGGGGGSSSSTGGGGTGGGGSTTTTVSGVVASGLVTGARITAYCAGTGIGSATSDSHGAYSISLSADCNGPVRLVATPPLTGSITAADEMSSAPVTVGPLGAGEQWMLRAYANLTASQANTRYITPFTDMAAAMIEKITALNAASGIQAPLPLSAGLVAAADAAVGVTVLGGDPRSMMSSASAAPTTPASLGAMSPIEQKQQMVALAALSVWASPLGSYQYVAGSSYFVPTSSCGDPVVCGTTGMPSALAVLEKALTDEIGVQIALADSPNNSQVVAFAPDTSQQATLPAYALQNIALGIEASGNPYGVPAGIATAAASLAGTVDAVSGLFVSSQFYIEHGRAF